MTSYRHPDYEIELDISLPNFRDIAGTSFETTVDFNKKQQNLESMMIIPETNQFPDISKKANAWLWSGNCIDIPEGAHVKIIVGKPCDPMLTPEEKKALLTEIGLRLEGVVVKNRNSVICDT